MSVMEKSTQNLIELLNKANSTDIHQLEETLFGKTTKHKTVHALVNELRYNGSNDVAYLFRGGEGVHYLEIVRDVAKRMKLKFDDNMGEEEIEQAIYIKFINDIFEKLSPEQKKEFIKETKKFTEKNNILPFWKTVPMGNIAGIVTYQTLMNFSKVAASQVIQKGALAAGGGWIAALGKVFFGPIGIAGTTAMVALDVMDPAYRKTIPSIVKIAEIRQKQKLRDIGVKY